MKQYRATTALTQLEDEVLVQTAFVPEDEPAKAGVDQAELVAGGVDAGSGLGSEL